MANKEYAMLIFTDAKDNNNKFYELILDDNDNVLTRWGRVGSEGQSKTCYGGLSEFNRIMRSKISKGYVKTQTIAVNTAQQTSKTELANAAKRDLLGTSLSDPKQQILIDLVEKLTQMNRHQIYAASNGNIQIDESGIIRTPLGLVTLSTIEDARKLLVSIEKYIDKSKFNDDKYINQLENYLKLIPQKVPAKRGWHETFFTNFSSLSQQNSFLDQLEGSIDLYKDKEKEALEKAKKEKGEIPTLFDTHLELVKDKTIIFDIEMFFNKTKNHNHVSSNLKLKNVFLLKNEKLDAQFSETAKKIGNVKTLWHGTRAFNVLSILKNGLIIPKGGGSYHITGRMFGDGIYFSDQSTKSLNYAYGYWDGGAKDNECFMFLADVAMGKEYTPTGPTSALPKAGYDSTFAKAQKSGVMNNEMIVYNINQCRLKYLCEFSK